MTAAILLSTILSVLLGAGSIGMVPPHQGVQVFEPLTIDIIINTGGADVDTVDLYIDFDPRHMQVDRVDIASVVTPTYNRFDNQAGRIDISASVFASPWLNGIYQIATLHIRASMTGTAQWELVRSGARQTQLYRAGLPVASVLRNATVVVQGDQLIQLSTRCPEHYLQVNQPLTCDHWITNISQRTMAGIVFVANDRYQGDCDEVAELPPMGVLHCWSPVYVEQDDWQRGYIQLDTMAWTVLETGYSWSNTTTNIIEQPVRVYLPGATKP